MRRAVLRLARVDVAEILLTQGRLSDFQMLNFFNSQVERQTEQELGERPAGAAIAASTEPSERAQAVASARKEKEAALQNFMTKQSKIQEIIRKDGPTAWVGEVYGREVWTTAYPTHRHCSAVEGAGGAAKLTGSCVAVGATGSAPQKVQLVARRGDGEELGLYEVALKQPAAQVQVGKMVNHSFLGLQLKDAVATAVTTLSPAQMAAQQHVLTAVAYKELLEEIQEVCALHATHHVQYDSLAIRDKNVQKRLSQIACFSYGISALTDYVVGDAEVSDSENFEHLLEKMARKTTVPAGGTAMPEMPLMESLMLSLYAESAFSDAVDHAWQVVLDVPLHTAQPHRSDPSRLINYPLLQQIFDSPKYYLMSSDGTMEAQILEFVAPHLHGAGEAAPGAPAADAPQLREVIDRVAAPLKRLLGFQSGGRVRLTGAHVNLTVVARNLEADLTNCLQMIEAQKRSKKQVVPGTAIAIALYLSEIVTTLAVLYRCTAALVFDEQGRGHREWLIAQSFCAASEERRKRIIFDMTLSTSAMEILKSSKDLDNYSTHPVELMNAAASAARNVEEKKQQPKEKKEKQ